MGYGYTFTADSKDGAIRKANDFARAIREISDRRVSIVGINRNHKKDKWQAVVDVCGLPSLKVAKIASNIEGG